MTGDIRWRETLRGRMVIGADVFRGSSASSGGIAFEFTVHGTIDSLERFRSQPPHRAKLEGVVSSALIGGRRRIEDGSMQMFRPTTSPSVTELVYELAFSDATGAKFKLHGVKTVRDDRGVDLWRDTSRLDVTLRNVTAPGARGDVVARGQLRISLLGFLVLFATIRTGDDDDRTHGDGEDASTARRLLGRAARHVALRTSFVYWFLRQLVRTYGNPFVVNSAAVQITGDRVGHVVEDEIDFEARPRVKWADPRVLWRTFVRLRRSSSIGKSIDARQAQAGEATVWTTSKHEAETWVDFVADTGDGFAATYTVAYAVSQPTLRTIADETARGTVLVLGGDLVYPTPTRDEYKHRLIGPLAAAMPRGEAGRHVVVTIPGNHDWYDNLQSYSHQFMSPGRKIGGRRTFQRHSYFALELPGRWWLLGMDVALDQRIDDKQVRFFQDLRDRMDDHDSVILVIAKPAWLEDPTSATARNLAYVERELIRPGTLRLVLSGDTHHYARYGSALFGPARLTCGGGGAYTAGTHHLPPALDSGWSTAIPADEVPLHRRYPSRKDSLRLRRGVLGALAVRLWFVLTAAVINLGLAAALLSDDATETTSTIDRLRAAEPAHAPEAVLRGLAANPVGFAVWLVVIVGLAALALSGRRRAGWPVAVGAGMVHITAQLTVLVSLLWWLLRVDVSGWLSALVVGAGTSLLGGCASAVVAGVYLRVTDRWELHPDIVFAVQGRTEFKSFLRFCLRASGDLDVYAYGIPEIVKMWQRNHNNDPSQPRLVPTAAPDATDRRQEAPPFVELIERLRFTSRIRRPTPPSSAARSRNSGQEQRAAGLAAEVAPLMHGRVGEEAHEGCQPTDGDDPRRDGGQHHHPAASDARRAERGSDLPAPSDPSPAAHRPRAEHATLPSPSEAATLDSAEPERATNGEGRCAGGSVRPAVSRDVGDGENPDVSELNDDGP